MSVEHIKVGAEKLLEAVHGGEELERDREEEEDEGWER